MMWQKGDLVYIPSNAKLNKLNWESMDYDNEGVAMSMGVDLQKGLETPSLGIVLDHESIMDMRKLFIPNTGFWYVSNRDIYEPRRKENDQVQRSCTGDRHAHG